MDLWSFVHLEEVYLSKTSAVADVQYLSPADISLLSSFLGMWWLVKDDPVFIHFLHEGDVNCFCQEQLHIDAPDYYGPDLRGFGRP